MRAKGPACRMSSPSHWNTLPLWAPCWRVSAVSTTTAEALDRRMCSPMYAYMQGSLQTPRELQRARAALKTHSLQAKVQG